MLIWYSFSYLFSYISKIIFIVTTILVRIIVFSMIFIYCWYVLISFYILLLPKFRGLFVHGCKHISANTYWAEDREYTSLIKNVLLDMYNYILNSSVGSTPLFGQSVSNMVLSTLSIGCFCTAGSVGGSAASWVAARLRSWLPTSGRRCQSENHPYLMFDQTTKEFLFDLSSQIYFSFEAWKACGESVSQ